MKPCCRARRPLESTSQGKRACRLTHLTPDQRKLVDEILRNESDVAYKRRMRRMLDYLDLAPGQTILDCGWGMGYYFPATSQLAPDCRLVGVDLDPHVLPMAHRQAAAASVKILVQRRSHAPADRHSILRPSGDDRSPGASARRRGGTGRGTSRAQAGGHPGADGPARRLFLLVRPINWLLERTIGGPIRRGPFAGIWANHERLYSEEQLVSVLMRAGFQIERFEPLTHYCFPGTQFIVYTLGKSLVEARLLPEFISRAADRSRGAENSGSKLNPINWALALFNWIDRWNEDAERMAHKRTFVNLAVKARKV